MVFYRLKDLIKAIRAAKTFQDEMSIIQKESAAIRTSFKEENSEARYQNVSKLLYIFMLGYPAHFGQIECLKLVASPRFTDKRLGYLGIMLLLDENQEVLTLVTNSLKNDLNHSNMYIVGLALCSLGNISSEEMARDLSSEVEKLLGSTNAYIRKKAALCAMRLCRKVPDYQELFLNRAKSLLNDRNHGVLLSGVTFITDMCKDNPSILQQFRRAVPLLVRSLKSLVTTGYSPEHDVTGVTDPFLQIKILRLLRILGKGDPEASEAMNDILTQVATNTESSKNVGNSILYETVLTILDIEADSSLRVLAINILGKFLSNRDNNIRYVALNTLNKVVAIDTNAVQRHRNIILDCLRDADISIRRRALELSFALINESNVRVLTRELLAFLEVADNEFKPTMTTQLCLAADKFAPNKRWHIDTVLRVLNLAGNYVREEILSSFIRLVANTPELQQYTVQKLYAALMADISQESLVNGGVWVIGEYGDALLQSGGASDEEEIVRDVKPSDVVTLFESILAGPYANQVTREYVLTALMKLTTRFTTQPEVERIRQLIMSYSTSIEVEIQQRSVEYGKLFDFDSIKVGVLERMPPPEIREEHKVMGQVENTPVGSTGKSDRDMLLDLIGDETALAGDSKVNGTAGSSTQQSTNDLLADIFGASSSPAQLTNAPPSNADIMGLFGNPGASTTITSSSTPSSAMTTSSATASSQPANISSLGILDNLTSTTQVAPATAIPTANNPSTVVSERKIGDVYTAYDGNGLKITLQPSTDVSQPNNVFIMIKFYATTSSKIESMNLQAAPAKPQKLSMLAISNSSIMSDAPATQQMRVTVPPNTQVRFRLKIQFKVDGKDVMEMVDFRQFPIL